MDEKAQKLLRVKSELKNMDDEGMELPNKLLTCFLTRSMPSEYSTTIEIIMNDAKIDWTETVARLKAKEIDVNSEGGLSTLVGESVFAAN